MEAPETPSGSPLSDHDSEEFDDEPNYPNRGRSHSDATISASDEEFGTPESSSMRNLEMPPAKRRKTGASSYDRATPQSASTNIPPRSPTGSISSDSSGSVPTSPSFAHLGPTHPLFTAHAAAQANPDNPEMGDYVQVTKCMWDGCANPEQGNMDNLVAHINDIHIVPRQKKYYCEWEGCSRKGQPHTSAYALKAHMRSHTKEKPFMCALPECDRSFTRSDALAKHMRTVHETEALRPSDPVPKGHTGGISNGGAAAQASKPRLILTMGGKANGDKKAGRMADLLGDPMPPLPTTHTALLRGLSLDDVQIVDDGSEELHNAVDVDSVPFQLPIPPDFYPTEMYAEMEDYERDLPPSQYFRLLRRQIRWAEQEGVELERELKELRATTEDVHGHVVRKGAGDEASADENRKVQWQRTEELLDAILRAETEQVNEMFTGEKLDAGNQNPWDLIRALDKLAPKKSLEVDQ